MMRMVGMEVEWGCPQEGERGRWIKMMTCGHHRVKTQYVYMCNTCDTSEQEITCPKNGDQLIPLYICVLSIYNICGQEIHHHYAVWLCASLYKSRHHFK